MVPKLRGRLVRLVTEPTYCYGYSMVFKPGPVGYIWSRLTPTVMANCVAVYIGISCAANFITQLISLLGNIVKYISKKLTYSKSF